jgi:hypothetical protein|tara:strand:+ start:829 stop:1080 length:252 start_codon:yes stop_codon:yes gene_type:complete
MVSLSLTTTFASTQKKFKKFGKKLSKQRKGELNKIRENFNKISSEEKKRAQKLFEQHKNFFTEKAPTSVDTPTEVKPIEFFEK